MNTTIPALDPATYAAHALHREARIFSESNCYADLWIEILHALELEPCAMLSHVLPADFEGDQWTFFKPPGEDLRLLYGLSVEELQIYDCLLSHVGEQLKRGRIVLAEVDAFYLPDTAGTSYRTAHAKTTIGIERIDRNLGRLGYFHNSSYHRLEGDDFVGVLEPAAPLPPYVELVKLERLTRLADPELRRRSRTLFARDVARRPRENPLTSYERCFADHAARLRTGDLDGYHIYAFASLRQCGAAFELGARYLRWLFPGEPGVAAAAEDFEAIAAASKAAMLRLARAVSGGKPRDVAPLVAAAPRWDAAFDRLAWHAARCAAEAA